MKIIVITGGPCSGKTSSMEVLQAHFARQGRPAVFVAEAGTDLICQGISPKALGAMLPFQVRVAQLQLQREEVAKQQAVQLGSRQEGRPELSQSCEGASGQLAAQQPEALVVCDRGIADGAAYLGSAEYAQVLDTVGLAPEQVFARYDAVFCLESAAKEGAGEGAYTTGNNDARSETAAEAAALDTRTVAAWEAHPRFCLVRNAPTFEEKAAALIFAIEDYLADAYSFRNKVNHKAKN